MRSICVINTSGNYGGAEKRLVTLFGHVSSERNDIILIINSELYRAMAEKGLLSWQNNISIVNIPFDKKDLSVSVTDERSKGGKPKNKSRMRYAAGRYKYFFKTVFQWMIFSFHLIGILNKKKIKTVYTIWQGGIWGRKVFKLLNVKVIYSANSNLVWHLERGVLNRFDSQFKILRDASHVDFLSHGLVEELNGLMPTEDFPENYSVSPCSFIDYQKFQPVYPKEDTVIFMGRLVELKNPVLFLEAVKLFDQIYSSSQQIKFLVLGSGPFENEMKRFVAENSLSNVLFKGKVARPEAFLKKSKVFVSIQQTENYPSQAMMEAMACENAIVSTDVGETRKLVTEQEGVLVKPEAQEIVNALIALFSDGEMCSRMGRNAVEKVRKEHTVERFAEYFYSLMK